MVYPWTLVFGADELAAFEAAATVLLNWGQAFYEYHPNPPVEVLRDADAVLQSMSPALRAHLLAIGCSAQQWAWPLLASLFAQRFKQLLGQFGVFHSLRRGDPGVGLDLVARTTPQLLPCIIRAIRRGCG